MSKSIPIGLSLPIEMVDILDQERADIPRSRYVLRILERIYLNTGTEFEKIKRKDSPNEGLEAGKLGEARSF